MRDIYDIKIDNGTILSSNPSRDLFPSGKKGPVYLHKSGLSFIDTRKESSYKLYHNKVISLFSGAGGLDIGLEGAGFQTSVCIEIDADCRETLRSNRPFWRLFEKSDDRIPGDIKSISVKELLSFAKLKKGEISIVAGGAPCQPFSNIGKKYGKEDPINGDLFLEFVRIIKGALPAAFIFENVAGIAHNRNIEVIDYMKSAFLGLGYGTACTILNAADYGVAQRRARFFLIGIKGISNPSFPLPTHCKGSNEWDKFVQALDHSPNSLPKPWVTLKEVLLRIPKDYKKRPDYAVMRISDVVQNRMQFIGPGENFKVLPMNIRPDCWRSGRHQGQDTFGRLRLGEPSVTIRTAAYNPAKGKYIHPTQNRGLDTVEMACIQDFPYEWLFKCKSREKVTLVSAGRQIGNAVPPSLARELGLAIKMQLNQL